jgi:hypothetical protein
VGEILFRENLMVLMMGQVAIKMYAGTSSGGARTITVTNAKKGWEVFGYDGSPLKAVEVHGKKTVFLRSDVAKLWDGSNYYLQVEGGEFVLVEGETSPPTCENFREQERLEVVEQARRQAEEARHQAEEAEVEAEIERRVQAEMEKRMRSSKTRSKSKAEHTQDHEPEKAPKQEPGPDFVKGLKVNVPKGFWHMTTAALLSGLAAFYATGAYHKK